MRVLLPPAPFFPHDSRATTGVTLYRRAPRGAMRRRVAPAGPTV
jgi:hypothetical protein